MFLVTCALVKVHVGMKVETRPITGLGMKKLLLKVTARYFRYRRIQYCDC